MKDRYSTSEIRQHRESVASYYDEANIYYYFMWHRRTFGLHYGLWFDDVNDRQQAILKENEYLAILANIKKGDSVLDAGCGVGGSSAWLAKNKGANVVGINLSDVQLGGAKRIVSEKKFKFEVADKTDFAKADYHQLPFKNDSFDVVWSLESIEHAQSVKEFVNESARVLKTGGRLVIAGTFSGNKIPNEEESRQLGVGLQTAGAFRDISNASAVRDLMKEAGFKYVYCWDFTNEVIPSAEQITNMCKWGYPVATILNKIAPRYVPKSIVLNNQWGLYQESLFRSNVTSYNVLVGEKGKI